MTPQPNILASAQAQFPASANRQVRVAFAWHPSKSTLDSPGANGDDGWDPVHDFATREVVERLAREGYTHLNLEVGGTANHFKDVPIAVLL